MRDAASYANSRVPWTVPVQMLYIYMCDLVYDLALHNLALGIG